MEAKYEKIIERLIPDDYDEPFNKDEFVRECVRIYKQLDTDEQRQLLKTIRTFFLRRSNNTSEINKILKEISESEDNNDSVLDEKYLSKFESVIHGTGVKTLIDIPYDTRIIEYKGDLISIEQKIERENSMIAKGDNKFYFFELTQSNRTIYIDATDSNSNLSRYINHSCSPNCIGHREGDKVFYYSLRSIFKGEELTVHYGDSFFNNLKIRCNCGSTNCMQKQSSTPSLRNHNKDQVLFYLISSFFFFLSF